MEQSALATAHGQSDSADHTPSELARRRAAVALAFQQLDPGDGPSTGPVDHGSFKPLMTAT